MACHHIVVSRCSRQADSTPTREAINERGARSYLNYEIRLDNFEIEHAEDGTPKQFCAAVAIDGKVVEIEVNSPYSQRYGEDIYLVSYESNRCILQIVREPWRIVTATGVVMLLLGALMLFLQGFQNRVR
jgi:cytochrome c biogenesis protein ResB